MDSFLKPETLFDNNNDLLNKLPNDILSHILSFLPLKLAARTSILSHRWRCLWTFIPDLEFISPGDLSESESKKFVSTLDQVLSLRGKSKINKLKLTFYSSGATDLSCITSWMKHAVDNNVRELDLQFMDDHKLLVFPPSFFSCKTLVTLKLQTWCFFNVPSSICFPSLKILHVLSCISEQAAERFCCGSCPVLEELFIDGYLKDGDITVTLNIAAPALKKLNIAVATSFKDQVIIDAPSCESLSIDCSAKLVVKSNLTAVLFVFIRFGKCFYHHGGYNWNYIRYLLEVLKKISNTKRLKVSGDAMAAVIGALQHYPFTFPNLRSLQLVIKNCCDWRFLPELLNNSPKLKILALEKQTRWCNLVREDYDWSSAENVPKCLSSRIKKISMKRFNGRKDELKLVEFFLNNGKALNQLILQPFGQALEDEEALLNKLLLLPRASETCVVKFMK